MPLGVFVFVGAGFLVAVVGVVVGALMGLGAILAAVVGMFAGYCAIPRSSAVRKAWFAVVVVPYALLLLLGWPLANVPQNAPHVFSLVATAVFRLWHEPAVVPVRESPFLAQTRIVHMAEFAAIVTAVLYGFEIVFAIADAVVTATLDALWPLGCPIPVLAAGSEYGFAARAIGSAAGARLAPCYASPRDVAVLDALWALAEAAMNALASCRDRRARAATTRSLRVASRAWLRRAAALERAQRHAGSALGCSSVADLIRSRRAQLATFLRMQEGDPGFGRLG